MIDIVTIVRQRYDLKIGDQVNIKDFMGCVLVEKIENSSQGFSHIADNEYKGVR